MDSHSSLLPSAWVRRFAPLIQGGGTVLDLACGTGRHSRLLAELGYQVEAVDKNEEALSALAGVSGITTRAIDLEDREWPYGSGQFDGVVVTNYLFRPRLKNLISALKPNGVLIYETFMVGNEQFGKPSNLDFLLRPGELLELVQPTMVVVAFEQGKVDEPKTAVTQRICAVFGGASVLTNKI